MGVALLLEDMKKGQDCHLVLVVIWLRRDPSSLNEPIASCLSQGGLSKCKEGRVFWNPWDTISSSWGRRHLFWQLLEEPLKGKLLVILCYGCVMVHSFRVSNLFHQVFRNELPKSLSKSILDLFLREACLKLVATWIFLHTWTSPWIYGKEKGNEGGTLETLYNYVCCICLVGGPGSSSFEKHDSDVSCSLSFLQGKIIYSWLQGASSSDACKTSVEIQISGILEENKKKKEPKTKTQKNFKEIGF